MTEEPQIRELEAQPAAVERAVTDPAGLPGTIDRTFPELFRRIAERGVDPAGPPFIRYLETGERLEIELGVPVSDGTSDQTLPPGRTAVLRYIGPYDGLRDACERLASWVAERGERASGPFWESYVTDPRSEPDASKRITDIYQPIE
jgi:effector-binding domain-containing protein